MRRIAFGLGSSLDGYIACSDGSVDFMPKDGSMGPFFTTIEVGLRMSGGKSKPTA